MPTMTIVANTGLLIDTRVIHMASLRHSVACDRQLAFFGRLSSEARTIAGAPSLRLSNFAASTFALAGSVVFNSTRPASSSRRPIRTMRLASLPSWIVHTYDTPASVRTAVTGSVGDRRAGGKRDPAGGEHAAAQRLGGIRDADEHEDGARPGFGRRIDPLDASRELAIGEAVDGEVDRHAGLQLRNVGRGHQRLQFHVLQVDDGDER